MMDKKKCTAEAIGNVIEIKSQGLDSSTIITVEYRVADYAYKISETIKLKNETIKIGFLPVGQRKIPVMGEVAVGSTAFVMYNPDEPSMAFLRDNEGIMNC